MEKEEDKRTFSDHLLIIFYDVPRILMIGCLLFIIFIAVRSMYEEQANRAIEYETYGCYRVEKEYQECGPIEGKPGFTRCETKKKLVCPEVSN